MKKSIVVVGDVHGCIEELDELLKTLEYNKENMRLVFLGDLMDRGPDAGACIRRVRELDVECVMGNHEEKHLRWRKHESNAKLTGKLNPMKPMSEQEQLDNKNLSEEDIEWMKQLPTKIYLKNNWWAVHAGCEPRFALEKQSDSQLMRVRYVNEAGAARPLNKDKSQPENTFYWTEQWKGPENIIYGHCVHNLKTPRHDYNPYNNHPKNRNGIHCLGIDTGCCFGGHLTAAIFNDPEDLHVLNDLSIEYVQVKAKQKYYEGFGEE